MTVFGIYKIKHLSLWSCLRIAPWTVVWTEQPDWALLIKGGVSRLPFELWCERRAVQPKQFIIIYTVYITWSVSLVTVMIKDAYYHLFICDTPQNKYVQWATLKSCTITLSRQNLHVNIKKNCYLSVSVTYRSCFICEPEASDTTMKRATCVEAPFISQPCPQSSASTDHTGQYVTSLHGGYAESSSSFEAHMGWNDLNLLNLK